MMPLTSSAVSPDLLNIARHLPAMAMRHPEQDAVIHSKDGSRLTFVTSMKMPTGTPMD